MPTTRLAIAVMLLLLLIVPAVAQDGGEGSGGDDGGPPEPGACLFVASLDPGSIGVCWDDTTESECLEGFNADGWFEGRACASLLDWTWEGVCLVRDECCLIDATDNQNITGADACDSRGGRWVPGVDCETVPVELQSFEVER